MLEIASLFHIYVITLILVVLNEVLVVNVNSARM